MRLLLFTTEFPTPANPLKGTFNLTMAAALAQRHDVTVVAPVPWVERLSRRALTLDDPQLAAVRASYPTYYYTPRVARTGYAGFMWHSVRRLRNQLVSGTRPDLVLSYWAHPDGAVAARLAETANVPAVLMVGGSDVLLLTRDAQRRRQVQAALDRSAAVIAVSGHLQRALHDLGVPSSKISVVRRGIDPTRFSPGDPQAARTALGVGPTTRLLVWAGRLAPEKDLDTLLEACRQLKDGGVVFELRVLGEGPLKQHVQADIHRLRLGDSVRVEGAVAQSLLPQWYRAADLVVLSSRSEGIPNVLLEAAACGARLVATDVGGVREIADPTCDTLVPPGDPQKFAEAIRATLDRGSARRSIHLRTIGEATDQLEAVLERVRTCR